MNCFFTKINIKECEQYSNYKKWKKDYEYNPVSNEFENPEIKDTIAREVNEWFKLD